MSFAKETIIAALDYLDNDEVCVYLRQPNVDITLPVEQARDPLAFKWRVRKKFNGKYLVHGKSFDSPTRKLCEKRWRELWELAPFGLNGEFYPAEPGSSPVGIEAVLKAT